MNGFYSRCRSFLKPQHWVVCADIPTDGVMQRLSFGSLAFMRALGLNVGPSLRG